eukprot:gb/GECG01014236.1/.p1 GENE.gb/GECG01014236.1/~~gb/GECG01014236.1/.p1  ORF type:complete len:324 (+),score=36.63 gb/GECG01014236.1/:1-972(+)
MAPAKKKQFRGRVNRACQWCASKKLKCDGERPCLRCVTKGIEGECVDAVPNGELGKRSRHQSSLPKNGSNANAKGDARGQMTAAAAAEYQEVESVTGGTCCNSTPATISTVGQTCTERIESHMTADDIAAPENAKRRDTGHSKMNSGGQRTESYVSLSKSEDFAVSIEIPEQTGTNILNGYGQTMEFSSFHRSELPAWVVGSQLASNGTTCSELPSLDPALSYYDMLTGTASASTANDSFTIEGCHDGTTEMALAPQPILPTNGALQLEPAMEDGTFRSFSPIPRLSAANYLAEDPYGWGMLDEEWNCASPDEWLVDCLPSGG